MGRFWDALTGAGDDEVEQRSGLANPEGWLMEAIAGPASPSGQRVTVEKAIRLSPVWSAVRIISEQIGQLPLKVYRKDENGDREVADQHRAWRLLHDKPNPYTPAGTFWATASRHLMLWGNFFILKRATAGFLVDELYLMNPDEITVTWDPNTYTKGFLWTPSNGRERQRFTDEQILHGFDMSFDGLIGESVINCKAALGAAMARDEYEGGFYRDGAVVPGALKHPGRLSSQAKTNLSQSFAERYAGVNQRNGRSNTGIPVFEEGLEYVQMGSPIKDMQFVESQQLSRTDIAVMFGLPPSYLGGSTGDSLTYATVEGNQIQFATNAIAPRTTTIAKALSWDPSILPQNVFDCEFVLEAMMRGDANARATYYEKAIANKWMTSDEVRVRENLPPLTAAQKRELNPPPPPVLAPEPAVDQLPSTQNGSLNGSNNGNQEANGALARR